MSKTSPTETIALTIEETAETLRLGRDSVLALLRRDPNPIPSFRFGKRVVIPRRELIEWAANEARGTHNP